MMQVMLQIPDSLPHQAMELAQREQVSLEQLMLSALSEKVRKFLNLFFR
jgi:predicted HicB family RNase H-like nuclease